jgi:hypothetical protein
MRKAMLLLAVLGLVGTLWAAEPLGVGTWKLNLVKSKLPASAAKMKEQITVFRALDADTMEGTSTTTQIDGTTSVEQWTVPINGGTMTYQQGRMKGVEGLLIITTRIDTYTTHNTFVSKRVGVPGPTIENRTNPLIAMAALEALSGQLHNLEETIGRLLELMKSLPEGEIRETLFREISCLDAISDVMRQALDSCTYSKG